MFTVLLKGLALGILTLQGFHWDFAIFSSNKQTSAGVFSPVQCSLRWVSKHTNQATHSLCFPLSSSTTGKTANLSLMKKNSSCEFLRRRVRGGVQGKTPNTARPVITSQQLTALPESAEATG